jgi:hypothetical protein
MISSSISKPGMDTFKAHTHTLPEAHPGAGLKPNLNPEKKH